MHETADVQISVSGISETALQKIDLIAEREHRPRNRQIVKWLEEAIAADEAERMKAAGRKSKLPA